jgi:uncharacterized protein (DUF58 family)
MALPTRRGFALLGIAVAAYLAARAFGTWELSLLSYAFLAAVLIAWLLAPGGARGLVADRELVPDRPEAGDPLKLVISLRNRALVPGLQVTVEDAAAGLGSTRETVTFESLRPRREAVAVTAERPARRGLHRLPEMTAVAEDPLGLVRVRLRLGRSLDVTVYPRLVRLDSCGLVGDAGARGRQGDGGRRAPGTSEFRGIRPADPGEPLSHVDWKATAKTGTLMMRDLGDPGGRDITLLLEGTASRVVGQPPWTNYELALQTLGSVADFSLRTGRIVDLLLHEARWRQLRLAPDPGGRRRLREALAAAEATASTPLPAALRRLAHDRDSLLRTENLLVVVLALDDDVVRALSELRTAGVSVAVICVAAASFGAPAAAAAIPGAESREPLRSLASLGVACLHLRAGDDLRAALAARPTTRLRVGVR